MSHTSLNTAAGSVCWGNEANRLTTFPGKTQYKDVLYRQTSLRMNQTNSSNNEFRSETGPGSCPQLGDNTMLFQNKSISVQVDSHQFR